MMRKCSLIFSTAKNFETKNFKFFFKIFSFFIFVYSKTKILLEKFCLFAKVALFWAVGSLLAQSELTKFIINNLVPSLVKDNKNVDDLKING